MRFNSSRHRAMMAMAATGVLTALAPAVPAFAGEEGKVNAEAANVAVADVGIRSYRGDKVVEAAYNELNSDHIYESPYNSNCNFYSNFWNKPCQAWCADFAKFVWKNGGAYDWQSLDSEAGTLARWGRKWGLWHYGTAGIFPGAGVTYNSSGDPFVDSDHVGIFVGWVNGQAKVISGNYGNSFSDGRGGRVYKHNLYYGTAIAGWTDPAQ